MKHFCITKTYPDTENRPIPPMVINAFSDDHLETDIIDLWEEFKKTEPDSDSQFVETLKEDGFIVEENDAIPVSLD